MVLRQLERLGRSQMIDQLVVATSIDPSDDPLVEILEAEDVVVRRGSLNDVAGRFAGIVEEFNPTNIVRLTADCPLTDPAIIDRVISEHLESGANYTSNTLERTYPQGLDVECVDYDSFMALMALPLTASEREHVTLGIYDRPGQFTLHSVRQERDLSRLRWTVDLPADLVFVRAVYKNLYDGNPDFDQADVLGLLEQIPGLNRVNE